MRSLLVCGIFRSRYINLFYCRVFWGFNDTRDRRRALPLLPLHTIGKSHVELALGDAAVRTRLHLPHRRVFMVRTIFESSTCYPASLLPADTFKLDCKLSRAAYIDYQSGGGGAHPVCARKNWNEMTGVNQHHHHVSVVRIHGGDGNDNPWTMPVRSGNHRPPFNPSGDVNDQTYDWTPFDPQDNGDISPADDSSAPPRPARFGSNMKTLGKSQMAALGMALKPPWSRGAPVGDSDIHNAIMSSATIGAFFKASQQHSSRV